MFRSVRDMLSHDVGSIVCNDKNVAKNLTALMRERNLPYKDEVRFYEGAYDIYDAFNILSEVDKLLDKRVKLQNGVELVIEQTEALTVIDVNTAQFAKGDNHEETVFRANLEATGEIARQIRLRNVGGIIIVDFIDMVDESHKIAVVEELKRHFVFDRTKTRVASMTSLGLVEITRKKIGKELSSLLLADCPYCDGEAKSYNVDYVARKIKAELKQIFAKQKDASNVLITVNSVLFDELLRGNRFSTDCETIWSDKRIYVAPQKDILNCNFKIKIVGGAMIDVPNSARLLR